MTALPSSKNEAGRSSLSEGGCKRLATDTIHCPAVIPSVGRGLEDTVTEGVLKIWRLQVIARDLTLDRVNSDKCPDSLPPTLGQRHVRNRNGHGGNSL